VGGQTPVEFAVKPELHGGIDLSANGLRVVWGLEEALAGLEARVRQKSLHPEPSLP
jgi:hypothetical protein